MSERLATVGPLEVREFHGGEKRGPCIQITVVNGEGFGRGYGQLGREEVAQLATVLNGWLGEPDATLRADAAMWRRLVSLRRIRTIGSAGLGKPGQQYIGIELWDTHPEDDKGGLETLRTMLAALSPAEPAAPKVIKLGIPAACDICGRPAMQLCGEDEKPRCLRPDCDAVGIAKAKARRPAAPKFSEVRDQPVLSATKTADGFRVEPAAPSGEVVFVGVAGVAPDRSAHRHTVSADDNFGDMPRCTTDPKCVLPAGHDAEPAEPNPDRCTDPFCEADHHYDDPVEEKHESEGTLRVSKGECLGCNEPLTKCSCPDASLTPEELAKCDATTEAHKKRHPVVCVDINGDYWHKDGERCENCGFGIDIHLQPEPASEAAADLGIDQPTGEAIEVIVDRWAGEECEEQLAEEILRLVKQDRAARDAELAKVREDLETTKRALFQMQEAAKEITAKLKGSERWRERWANAHEAAEKRLVVAERRAKEADNAKARACSARDWRRELYRREKERRKATAQRIAEAVEWARKRLGAGYLGELERILVEPA